MAETVTRFQLPLFTFMLKDESGAVFFRTPQGLWLPLFTSLENAALYQTRGQLDCRIREFARWEEVLAFVSDPPSRAKDVRASCDHLVIDPIAPEGDDWVLFDRIAFLAGIKEKLTKTSGGS